MDWVAFGFIVLAAGLIALVLGTILLFVAISEYRAYRGYPVEDPDRVTATDQLVDMLIKMINILAVTVLGIVWVLVTWGRPPSPQPLTPLAWCIVVTLVILAINPVVQGIRSLIYRQHMRRIARLIRDTDPNLLNRYTTGQLMILRAAGELLRGIDNAVDKDKSANVSVTIQVQDPSLLGIVKE